MGQAASRPPTAGTYGRLEEGTRPPDTRCCACLPLLPVPPAPRVKGWAKRHRARSAASSPSGATPQKAFVSTGSGDGDAGAGAAGCGSRCIAGPTDLADGYGPDTAGASHGEREVDASSSSAEEVKPEDGASGNAGGSVIAVAATPVSCMTMSSSTVPTPSGVAGGQAPTCRAVTLCPEGCSSSSSLKAATLVGRACYAAPAANENAVTCVSEGSCDKGAAAFTVLAADVSCLAKPWQAATSRGPTAEMIQAFLQQQQRALIVLPIFHQRLLFIDDRRIFRRRPDGPHDSTDSLGGTSGAQPPSPVARVIGYLGLDSPPANPLPPPFHPQPARPGRPDLAAVAHSAMSAAPGEGRGMRVDAMSSETCIAAALPVPEAYVVVPVPPRADLAGGMQVVGVVEDGAAIYYCNNAGGATSGTEEEVVAPPSEVAVAVVVEEESSGAVTAAGPIKSEHGTPRESLTAFLASVPADVDGLYCSICDGLKAVPGGKVGKAGVMAWWRDILPRELQAHYTRSYTVVFLLFCRKQKNLKRQRICPLPEPGEVAELLGLLTSEALQLFVLLGVVDYSLSPKRYQRDNPSYTPKIVIASVGATILECSQFQRPVLDAFRSALLDDEVALREGFGPDVVDSMLEEVEANKAAKLQQQAQPTTEAPAHHQQQPEQEGEEQQQQQQQQQQAQPPVQRQGGGQNDDVVAANNSPSVQPSVWGRPPHHQQQQQQQQQCNAPAKPPQPTMAALLDPNNRAVASNVDRQRLQAWRPPPPPPPRRHEEQQERERVRAGVPRGAKPQRQRHR